MEPEGRPLTPGTSYGPPALASAEPFVSRPPQASCPPDVGRGPMAANRSWAPAADEDSEQTEGSDPGRSAQRRFRCSAFPSSLSWDSDSERETLDEEELQHFSNPHGLAAHSPGSPSAGLRFDSDDDEAEELPLQTQTDRRPPVEGHNNDSTKTEEPNAPRLGPTLPSGSEVWNVSDGAELFLHNLKPKEGCQMEEEAENSEGEKSLKGKETQEPERDVYSFPGDSDPESPPPAPWAHCTFIQRCKKKRVLLRPFSGLGNMKHTAPEAGKRARASPQKPETAEAAQPSRGGGVYDFEEAGFAEGAAEEPMSFPDSGGKTGKEEDRAGEPGKEIFTCVECSIYFQKQVHLREHMVEHCQSAPAGGRRSGKAGRFRCLECGWNLPNRLALADHHKRHQESRLKILEEIEKLNESGKSGGNQSPDAKALKRKNPDPAVTQDSSSVPAPGRVSDPEIVPAPPLSPAPLSAPQADPALVESDTSPSNSVQSPAQVRAASANRRRFVCSKCNFSTKTPQALANHSKTHNRKKPGPQVDSPPGSPSCVLTSPLACGHCAFMTPRQTALRQHLELVHPGGVTHRGGGADEPRLHSGSNVGVGTAKPVLDSDELSDSGSLPDSAGGKRGQGDTGSEDSPAPNRAPARPEGRLAGRRVFNRGFSRRGRTWTTGHVDQIHSRLEDPKLRGSEEEDQDEDQSRALDTELSQQMSNSPGDKPLTSTRSNRDDSSATDLVPSKQSSKDEGRQELEKDAKVSLLRRSARVTAAAADSDSDSDGDVGGDSDEERVRRFLSEGISDADNDEADEDAEALKSVERKCPYCPDRFHNGIGLANHVRGHLNRVGVSYNVRHFISPEEVNAIEKKFSYQKKKKKVANFDPDTFSVMHCEFCSAGFDTRAGLSSHARAHLRDFGITNWDVTVSPIHILRELFSSRPDLVIPTGPPRSLSSPPEDEEDEDLEEEGGGIIEVKLEGDTGERTVGEARTPGNPSQHWKEEEEEEDGGDEDEAGDEDEDEEPQLPALDHLSPGPGKTVPSRADSDSLSPGEDADGKVHSLKCEVCGARFETRRGLSSHARSHLRQLGVGVSESSGAPIDLLYQIAKERGTDGAALPDPAGDSSPAAPHKHEDLDDMDLDEKPIPFSLLAKAAPPSSSSTPSPGASPAPPPSASPSPVVRKAPISSLLPVSSPLRSPEHKSSGIKGPACSPPGPAAKPLWAPQESDAPLNLALDVDPNKDIVCQLCGAWFETRKGLSSHARAHLRHFGVEYSESKGSPIDLLNQLIETDDFKHKAGALQLDGHADAHAKQALLAVSSSSASPLLYKVTADGGGSASKATSSSGSSLLAPSAKRLKSSSMQVFRLSSGELMALPHSEPLKEIGCEFCGEYFENRKGLSSHARSHLRQMGITEWSVNGSPIDTLREVMHKRALGSRSQSDRGVKKESSQGASSPPWANAAGSGASEGLAASGYQGAKLRKSPLSLLQSGSRLHKQGLGSVGPAAAQSGGKLFRVSPLGKRPLSEGGQPGETPHSPPHQPKTFSSLPHDFSLKRKSSPDKQGHQDPSCELCGFYFENRKALASHARAHLRQFGVTEWCVNGSPIETLSAWMRSRPQKVLEMHRSYMQGNRSSLKKKASSSSSSSSSQWSSSLAVSLVRPLSREGFQASSKAADSEAGTNRQAAAIRPGRGSPSLSRLSGGVPLQAQVARSELNVRLPRGFERRPLKHPSCPDGTERDPPRPPRTGTVPALVPKPPSYPLVKLVGKFYTLKCRFCEVEFHGPLSVQEDWIRHLQQHILKMNYSKAAVPKPEDPAPAPAPSPTPKPPPTRTTAPSGRSPTPPAEPAPVVTATEMVKVSEQRPALTPPPPPLPTQSV